MNEDLCNNLIYTVLQKRTKDCNLHLSSRPGLMLGLFIFSEFEVTESEDGADDAAEHGDD